MATKTTPGESAGKGTRKTPSSGAKKTTAVKAGASKKPAAKTKAISKEEIERKAHEIYLERIAKGEPGSHEGDWHKAAEMLGKKK